MKKIIFILILIFGITGSFSVFAHGVEEEAKGKAILGKLEAKEISCESLTDEDFEVLGEYFMGQMAGTSHEAMNKMMEQMMGKDGEEKMHVVMGKRMSGCDSNAQMPESTMDMMSTMGGMMNSRTRSMGNMMGWSNFGLRSGWAWVGWVLTLLFWVLIIVWIIIPIKWLINQITGKSKEKSALDVLKERYAKGEISKEEFEEKKKDLI